MSEDFSCSNLIPIVLCEAVEGQNTRQRMRERQRGNERERKTRGETTL